jgi:Protein of unknown function (DUF3306)
MSGSENFIVRWSRRKRAAAGEDDASARAAGSRSPPNPPPQGEREQIEFAAAPSAQTGDSGAVAADLANLPPIESITAVSDIRAFLAPGVPAELTRAALRRAWAADPTIRDFVGLSENAWDFNAPDGVAGFGPLEMTEELRARIVQLVGRSTAAPEEAEAPVPVRAEPREQNAPDEIVQHQQPDRGETARQGDSLASLPGLTRQSIASDEGLCSMDARVKPAHDTAAAARRSHGGALPQ